MGSEQRSMGWVDRLLGRESRVKATSTQIADDIAATVAQLTDRLITDLRKTRPPQDEAVFRLECLILTAFPLDVILRAEFGTHSDEIRSKLQERLFVAFQSVGELPMRKFPDFSAHFEQRASEYMAAWKSAEAGSGQRRLGRVAGQAIYGPDAAFGINEMFACSSLVAVTFKSFKGFSSKYEVCG